MSDSNIETVRTFYDAMSRGDLEHLFERFAPTIDWREADGVPYADGNPYTTPQAVAEGVLGRIVRDWDCFAVTPERFVAGGESVVMLGRYRGVYRATGKALDVPVCHAWIVSGGLIRAFQQYVDTVVVQRCTAWSPASPWLRANNARAVGA